MRPLTVALPFFVAASALQGQETDAADRVHLEFRWPVGTTASVEAFRSKVKTGDADSGTSQFGARYRMTLGEAPDGYIIRYDGFSVPGGTASLDQQLAGLVPSYHVSREGDFQRLADPTRLRRAMDSMLAPVLSELDEKEPKARPLLASLVSDEMLTMTAAQDWNSLVGNWIGAELEVGAAYESEVVERVPLFGGVDLPMVYEFGAAEYVACNEADAEESCIELLMSSEPRSDAPPRWSGRSSAP